MSNNVRNVTKQLLGAEDVAFGRGVVEQQRGSATVSIHKLDLDLPVADESELATTNPNVYPKASIGSRLFVAVNGQYQELSHIVPVIYRVGGMLSAEYPYCSNEDVIAKWTGVFPKTLTSEDADFSPAGWKIVNQADKGLRADLAPLNGIKQLKVDSGIVQTVKGFYAGTSIGGGSFVYDASKSKADHNGGTVIAPEAIAAWDGTAAGIATLLNWTGAGSGCYVRITVPYATMSANWFGAGSGKTNYIDHLPIQAALDSIGTTLQSGGVVTCDAGIEYGIGGLIHVKTNQTLDFSNSLAYAQSGLAKAFLVGATIGDPALSYSSKLLNYFAIAQSNNTILVHLYQTQGAKLVGRTEGPAVAANRVLATWIDGGDASSFFNWIEVKNNHIYESFRIASSGVSFATCQYFVNCTVFGDKLYGNTDSNGWNFGADNGRPEGQGSFIQGGNVEQCGTGIYMSNFAGPVYISTRFEQASNTRDIWFRGNSTTANTVVGSADHINCVWDNPATATTVFVDGLGIVGVPSGTRKYKGNTQFVQPTTFIGSTDGADGTGYVALQSGIGSAATGAGFTAYSAAHSSFPGDFVASPTGSGVFAVGYNLFGAGGRIFKVSAPAVTAARDNVASCGSSSERWTQVFAVNGTINTSDAREKTPVRAMTQEEIAASKALAKEIGFYKWLDAVKAKGDSAREHCGFTVQRVIEILESHGLDAMSYGFICYDEWSETSEVTVEIDGETHISQPYIAAGNRYSFRDGELMKFIARGFDARLTALENK